MNDRAIALSLLVQCLKCLHMKMNASIPEFAPDFLVRAYRQRHKERLVTELENAPFSSWEAADGTQIVGERATGFLWLWIDQSADAEEGRKIAAEAQYANLKGWRLPSRDELLQFARTPGNPMRQERPYRLLGKFNWLCASGNLDLDDNCFALSSADKGHLIFCNEVAAESAHALVDWATDHGWICKDHNLKALTEHLREPDLCEVLADMDYVIARQPRLDSTLFTDPNKGLWEAWGLMESEQARFGVRARNPARDVREGFVAIDFGTSSTVVAWDNNGRSELMRVGVKDFWAGEQPHDYENPTVLEFIDLPSMLSAWQSTAYRPSVLWDQVRCSHEALHNWRNSESDPKVVSSILGKIKQWALRQENDHRLRVTDQKNSHEHEFAPLTPRNPVKGQPLTVSSEDTFDPVEMYAWFLGMNINWRQRGIFLKYYMSFPVEYPQSVKDNILAAFRRGLQRSLPKTLVNQDIFSDFAVQEWASEPTAYAAIALPALGIEPGVGTGEGYAVFDFGGGTADFDFGFYRQPDSDEDEQGWEAVFERCGSAGDKFLGGENLLENLAYLTFRHNLELCRAKKIAFTRPLDAENFTGSEMLLENTRAATTNTLMLMSRLRPLWETSDLAGDGSGVTKIELLARDESKVACELAIPVDALLDYLQLRIEKGIQSFFAAMRAAFSDGLPRRVHVLLAGNSSRSRIVSDLFGLANGSPDEAQRSRSHQRTLDYLASLFGERSPEVMVYAPLDPDPNNVYRPTAKTGVALGLLKLCPGSVIKVIDHARDDAGNEAPFAWHVGRIRQSRFQSGLQQGAAYGEWHELGLPRERVFNLFYTQSALAYTGVLGEEHMDLNKRLIHLAGDTTGQKVFGRAVKPSQIEICTAVSKEAVQQSAYENLRSIDLN